MTTSGPGRRSSLYLDFFSNRSNIVNLNQTSLLGFF